MNSLGQWKPVEFQPKPGLVFAEFRDVVSIRPALLSASLGEQPWPERDAAVSESFVLASMSSLI